MTANATTPRGTAQRLVAPAFAGDQVSGGAAPRGNAATAGIAGNGASVLRQHSDLDALDSIAPATPVLGTGLSDSNGLLVTSSTRSSPASAGKAIAEETHAVDPQSSMVTVQMKITRILQRFLVRSPHTFIAMTSVFISLYYVLGKESMAYSATTFVGVGGTVYCLTRAIFLEFIPLWLLRNDGSSRKWRHLMCVTYTAFITVIFTSAVWKLPDLTATQGLFFLTVSFGAPYTFVAKYYPDIDKQPTYREQVNDVPRDR